MVLEDLFLTGGGVGVQKTSKVVLVLKRRLKCRRNLSSSPKCGRSFNSSLMCRRNFSSSLMCVVLGDFFLIGGGRTIHPRPENLNPTPKS